MALRQNPILLFLVLCSGCSIASTSSTSKPNIVFILTDDQDVVLGGLTPLKKAETLIGQHGVKFDNMFVTSPLCCPSRSSILTGQYIHNHRARNNSISGGCSSPGWQQGPEKHSVSTYVKKLGYRTFFGGKYLNQYGMPQVGGPEHVPPGWDEWVGLVGNSRYYNYTLSVNGNPEKHGDTYASDYLTDILKEHAVSFINEQSEASPPFFMMVATPACHAPFTPAPQYKDNFNTSKAPRTKSFNTAGGPTKHWLIRNTPHPMKDSSINASDSIFRNRWRTLLSVDDLVDQVVQALDKGKHLENTYIIFSSDNGFHLGQFSLPQDKRQLYEFDVRVPFMIRGPGVTANKTSQSPILNIDIAPTIVELAGGKAPESMDGRSILPLLKADGESSHKGGNANWRTDFLVQHFGEGDLKIGGCPQLSPGVSCCWPNCVCEDAWNNTYSCVRSLSSSEDMMYCEFNDKEAFVELYDIKKDPDQLTNIVKKVAPKFLAKKHSRLVDLATCAGDSCREAYSETEDLGL
ncbi:N-acetylglucosamine-6-sulfatase [Pocillopora verrucosa]|uniref:N-acetylglucosamine-6-sulfatase n=1 Tax=Pocillopora verrucosa TaxID=203993 RepID=UPI002797828B|nr:N-acetylglucosamine-6-sulfatase-like [Pocillopora verrucosa]